ncbi:unnamed protein product [Cuscuta europaea]|uniref:Uncharacterized protein n=1 Tax=Cuscuta europaea TaxID=41803 RepID=A0A9P0YM08_CUSEU|nr:unnamed protein product [Cuscuta europaea]
MRIWGFITSGTDLLKRNTPDPVKRACTASYGYGAAAVGMIGNACGQVGIRHLNPVHYVPDGETRSKIVSFTTKFVKNAAVYTFEEVCKKNTALIRRPFRTVFSSSPFVVVVVFSDCCGRG